MSLPISFSLKPHPNYFVDVGDYPALSLKLLMQPLGKVLVDQSFDIAFAGSTTSAGVDAYLSGLPIVVLLSDTELNFSPLRGTPGVRFVSTPEELNETFDQVRDRPAPEVERQEFFCLDPALPRWRQILGLQEASNR